MAMRLMITIMATMPEVIPDVTMTSDDDHQATTMSHSAAGLRFC